MKRTAAQSDAVILALKEKNLADLFIADDGSPSITLLIDDKYQTYFVNSTEWKSRLISLIRKNSWHATDSRLKEIIAELCALAHESEIRRKTFVRIASHEGKTYIDLNNDSSEFVEISKTGFLIKKKSPVPFIRPAKQLPLPRPVHVERREFLNAFKHWFGGDSDQWLLILIFLLKCLHRDQGAYAILLIEGPQGSGKSTLSRRLKMLIDPSEPFSYSPPNNTDDVIVASVHSFLLVFDNMSGFSAKFADIFCRLSTGGGISKRKHYENHGEAFYPLHRPCIINGIDEPTTRADFLDRCVTIRLSKMSGGTHASEAELTKKFEAALPELLGGLYLFFAECLRVLPSIKTNGLSRMSDFDRMGLASEKILGLKQGGFRTVYEKNRSEQSEESFWSDDMCCAVFRALEKHGTIRGTSDSLRKTLYTGRLGRGERNAPRSAKAFSSWLKRIEPLLSAKDIVVERDRSSLARTITIRWKKAPVSEESEPSLSQEFDL